MARTARDAPITEQSFTARTATRIKRKEVVVNIKYEHEAPAVDHSCEQEPEGRHSHRQDEHTINLSKHRRHKCEIGALGHDLEIHGVCCLLSRIGCPRSLVLVVLQETCIEFGDEKEQSAAMHGGDENGNGQIIDWSYPHESTSPVLVEDTTGFIAVHIGTVPVENAHWNISIC